MAKTIEVKDSFVVPTKEDFIANAEEFEKLINKIVDSDDIDYMNKKALIKLLTPQHILSAVDINYRTLAKMPVPM